MIAAATSSTNGPSDISEPIDTTGVEDTVEVRGISDTAVTQGVLGVSIASGTIYHVIARDGLVLRGGPGTEFPVRRSLPCAIR